MTLSAVLPAVASAAATASVTATATASTGCHTLTVTVRDGGHALTRISAMLNNLSVRALSYRAADSSGLAVCEIVVPAADSPRAQAKLLRCVEIVELTAHPAV
ncbi:hypothetical protein [Streptomyces sp. NBC_00503]|uniref:hypothetical protein n=1 Tax=Streptomyces sp. NBC_00503 TaxID=2903659 RepID=UPI002E821417|nr:hypothetical protein [Streptomyces sp. NBC_00503]WUD79375.1 hypothetical protein OG490_01630 [Streptomyces sp. NBC_00503]